jgi:hypothetical protein
MNTPVAPDFSTLVPSNLNLIEEVKINYNLLEEND